MFRTILKAAMALAVVTAPCMAAASPSVGATLRATYIGVGGSTSVPYGWVDFCNRYVGECDTPVSAPLDINLTPKTLHIIAHINDVVNSTVKPLSDMDHWGVVDRWDYPTDGYGDCEDYALMKRKLLIEAGFPRQALLMTVVKDEEGEGHAILTVKTNKGEFVLDNLKDGVTAWNDTDYRYVKRQSQTDPNVWVTIGEPTSAPMTVAR